jgi:hypothetical protein
LSTACVVLVGLCLGGSSWATQRRARPVVKRVFDSAKRNVQLPEFFNIAGHSYLSATEYQDLRGGCLALLKRFPPHKFFFVGMGRDPAPVIAFLQNLGERELAANLPGTSNIGWKDNVHVADVARHVEAAIPQKILDGKRQLVLVDVTSSGKTPAIFKPFMDRYLQERGNPLPTVPLGMSWINLTRNDYGRAGQVEWFDVTPWPDFQGYYGCRGKYEGNWTEANGGYGIAEHQRHEMGPNVQPPTKTNPNYTAFRDALRQHMARDAELDQALSQMIAAAGQP